MKKQFALLLLLMSTSLVHADFLDGKLAYEIGDYSTAYTEFQDAAVETTDPESQADAFFHLAWMYENGLGVPADTKTALGYYRQAADLGQNQAQFALGYAYSTGTMGLETSPVESLKWYAKAANEGGNKDACYNLGVAYLNGIGKTVKQNPDLARTWFQVGSDLGSVESIYALSAIYYEGNGVVKDIPKSMALLKQASLMGFGQAAFYLAQLYENQKPLAGNDKKEAYYYYIKAQNLGFANKALVEKIDHIMLTLNEQEINEVQERIQREATEAKDREDKALALSNSEQPSQ